MDIPSKHIDVYKLVFNQDNSIRTITREMIKSHPTWCLLIMLKDLHSFGIDDQLITVENADNIIPLKVFDTALKCIDLAETRVNGYWGLDLEELNFLSKQGIVTSLALSKMMNHYSDKTARDILFECSLAEFEISCIGRSLICNSINHYISALPYFKSSRKILSYQIIKYTNITFILIDNIPVHINEEPNSLALEGTYKERLEKINKYAARPGNEYFNLYLNKLESNNIMRSMKSLKRKETPKGYSSTESSEHSLEVNSSYTTTIINRHNKPEVIMDEDIDYKCSKLKDIDYLWEKVSHYKSEVAKPKHVPSRSKRSISLSGPIICFAYEGDDYPSIIGRKINVKKLRNVEKLIKYKAPITIEIDKYSTIEIFLGYIRI